MNIMRGYLGMSRARLGVLRERPLDLSFNELQCRPFWMEEKFKYFLHFKRSEDPSSGT
jgi:hypothetical protein